MTRNPICAFERRTGFKHGAKVGFKDSKWEAQKDSALVTEKLERAGYKTRGIERLSETAEVAHLERRCHCAWPSTGRNRCAPDHHPGA
jgi:hypothetical protein